jgi:HK97 family phage prohead protease
VPEQGNIQPKLQIKSNGQHDCIVTGYASVFGVVDQHNDITVNGTFGQATKSPEMIKFLWQHDFLKPIGVIKSLTEDSYGLKIEASINSKVSTGIEAIELVKQGAIDSFSVGFHVKSYNYNDLGQRVITEGELLEVSLVTFPANHYAKIGHVTNSNQNHKLALFKQEISKLYLLTTKSNRRK